MQRQDSTDYIYPDVLYVQSTLLYMYNTYQKKKQKTVDMLLCMHATNMQPIIISKSVAMKSDGTEPFSAGNWFLWFIFFIFISTRYMYCTYI